MHASIEKISIENFSAIAEIFSIVSASDEFYYFPQVMLEKPEWETWDRFSPEFIIHFIKKSVAVLDLCGGQGRHAMELSLRVFTNITVLDYSDYLIQMGKKQAMGFSDISFQEDFMDRQTQGDYGTMTSRMVVKAYKPKTSRYVTNTGLNNFAKHD